jgi:hypothetical protein
MQGAQAGVVHHLAASITPIIAGIAAVIAQVAAIVGGLHRLTTGHVPRELAATATDFGATSGGFGLLLTRLAIRLGDLGVKGCEDPLVHLRQRRWSARSRLIEGGEQVGKATGVAAIVGKLALILTDLALILTDFTAILTDPRTGLSSRERGEQ